MTLYLELSTKLAARIADGDPAPGAPLPSVRALAASERTTPSTISRAYRELGAQLEIERHARADGRTL